MASNALSAGKGKVNRRPLLLAAVFGAISAGLIVVYLNSVKGSDDAPKQAASVPVVFALRPITERTQITDGMIEIKQIPVDAKHALAIGDKGAVVGQISRVRIEAGEQILSAKLTDQAREVGFSAVVPEGKRAVAIGVTEVISSGGHVSPGDYVDVIGVFQVSAAVDKDGKPLPGAAGLPSAGKNDNSDGKASFFSAMTILQHVQVLAVAQKSDQNIQPNAKSNQGDAAARSITLSVTPEQAQKLVLAEEIGKLRISLRPFSEPEDQRRINPATNTVGDLLGAN
jgi:pilus assembly protein CpaB